MNPFLRGIRNTFRHPLRTGSIVVMLGISLGLSVVMLASRSAVENRIASVKKSIGTSVTVSPAGARGFLGGGEPLTIQQVATLRSILHVTSVDATIDAQMAPGADTTLKSPIEAGTLGGRGARAFARNNSGSTSNESFTPPILAVGTTNASYGGSIVGGNISLTSGSAPDMAGTTNEALVGKSVAEKNLLSVGSTFTAYKTTIAVKGIFDAGNEFTNNVAVFPLQTLQRLSSQVDQVTSAVVHVDSSDNLKTVTDAVSGALGSAADVTSSQEEVDRATEPLMNIRRIATVSLLGTLVAGAIIILLIMVMVVRERRKEIAVLKALGAGSTTITAQFMSEAFGYAILGSVVGSILGVAFSNPILRTLISSSTGSTGAGRVVGAARDFTAGGNGAPPLRFAIGGARAIGNAVRDLHAVVDFHLLLYGLLVAIAIALIGSALPALLIGKIRPAEVLRND